MTRPVYVAPRPGYSGSSMALAFGGGAAVGAGSMYLANRLNDPWRHHYRPHYYGYHNTHSTHVVHHHHYVDSDGPYFYHQWQAPHSYRPVSFDSSRPPNLPRPYRSPRPSTKKGKVTSVLYFDASSEKIQPILYYISKDDENKLLRGSDEWMQNLAGGSKELGSLADQLRRQNFQQLEDGLDHYVQGIKRETNLVGVALCAVISSLPDYKGNVTAAQEALDKFSWTRKPKSKSWQFLSRILSAKEQARYELLSVARYKYNGVAAMDDLSGPRIGDAQLGEQSFNVNYREKLTTCNANTSYGAIFTRAAKELEEAQKALALPAIKKAPKWNGGADCDGAKADERVRQLGTKMQENGQEKPSEEDLRQQVMQDFPEAFASSETEKVRLTGAFVATGVFCSGVAHANLGFCSKPSKPCSDLKDTCGKKLDSSAEAACQEHKDKCEFLSPQYVVKKVISKYDEMKKDPKLKCADFYDIMYARVAVEQWFHEDARIVFSNEMGPTDVSAPTGIALMMLQVYENQKTPPPEGPRPSSSSSLSNSSSSPPGMSVTSSSSHYTSSSSSSTGRNYTASGPRPYFLVGILSIIIFACCCCCAIWLCCKYCMGDDDEEEVVIVPVQQPCIVPVQQPVVVSAPPEYLDFQCPYGSGPGDLVEVPLPDGTSMQVTVPPGIGAGMFFSVQVS